MVHYIYIVKCPDCEDEHFDFFNDAKDCALGCLQKNPIITQTEVTRNDFGECTDSCDLGTVWSWEDIVAQQPKETVFSKADFEGESELDQLDNSLHPTNAEPTIKQLVEMIEENEDIVECKWCEELYDKTDCRFEVDLGWLCERCIAAIKSRGETLTFREGPLEEDVNAGTVSKIATDILSEIAAGLSDEDKAQAIARLLTYVTPENFESLWEHIKNYFADRVLTEEDKDTLVRKTGINRDVLDGVDTVATAISVIYGLTPMALGIVIDVLQLTPIEDAVAGAATGGWGAIITSILSVIPEATIISALASIKNFIGHQIFVTLKDLFINKVLPEPEDEDLTEELTQLDEAFKYLATDPDAKIKILDELRADNLLKACVTEDDALSVNNCLRSTWSASGYQMDGRITDFNIDESGEIYITVRRSADKVLVYTLDDLKGRSSRSFLSYKLLTRIKEIASDLNKAMKPTKAELAAARTAERDANVLDALAKDPEVAKELKANVVRIEYRIPLNDFGYSVDDTDIEDIAISEKSADKLNKIHDNFMNLPFADAAIRAGIVEDRSPNTDYDRNISGSWGAIGNITFRVPIDSLSKNAQSLIQFAKYASKAKGEEDATEETKKKKSPKTICCYRLANALIQYFGNDVFFYRELAMAESAAGKVWYCVFDGQDVGTVTAASEEEALDMMQRMYPEYPYGMYDGCFWVEPADETLTESDVEHTFVNKSFTSWADGDIELLYDDLYVEYGYGGMVDNDWYSPPEPRHWFNGEVSHTFLVSPEDVAEFLINDCMTDEDVKDVPGGFDTLAEDDDAYNAFMEQHLDELIEKYKQKILDHWEEQAAEDYVEKQAESDDDDYGPDPDEIYERRRDGEL